MFDVCVPVQYDQNGEKKTKFVKIGIAFEGKKDSVGFVIKLDALPIGNTLVLTVPKEKKNYPGSKGGYGNRNTQRNNDQSNNEPANDGDVPF